MGTRFGLILLSSLVATTPAWAVPDSCDGGFGLLDGQKNAASEAHVVIEGTTFLEGAGNAVAMLDFNGDGIDDLAIGAPGEGTNGRNAGAVYIYYGSESLVPNPGSVLGAKTRADVVIFGAGAFDGAGFALANAGDVNNDGFEDLIIGTSGAKNGVWGGGSAYLLAGRASAGHVLDLASQATATFRGEFSGDQFGRAVAGKIDLNNDGYDDVIIGAPKYSGVGFEFGAAYVFYGPLTGTQIAANANVRMDGVSVSGQFGATLAAFPWGPGGSQPMVAVGAPLDVLGDQSAGAVFFFDGIWVPGAPGNPVPNRGHISAYNANLRILGHRSEQFGRAISTAGDVDGNGYPDFWIGAPLYNKNTTGAIFLFLNTPGLQSMRSAVAEYDHYVKIEGEAANDRLGNALIGGVDLNNDGYPDLVAAGRHGDSPNQAYTGAVWLLHGPYGAYTSTAQASMKVYSNFYNDLTGTAIAVGQFNGDQTDPNADRFPDLVVGSNARGQKGTGSGRTSIFLGGDDNVDEIMYYADLDNDGWGDQNSPVGLFCVPNGAVSSWIHDCDDSDPYFHPGAGEPVSGPDYNCDGVIGGIDNDGDGFVANVDCNDNDPTIFPGAQEICGDGIDNDCNGEVDDAIAYYPDRDGDGYGDASQAVRACRPPLLAAPVVTVGGDCDDNSFLVNPSALEVCDGIDNNCKDGVDEGTATDAKQYYADQDGDGAGSNDLTLAVYACSAPPGMVSNHADCMDIPGLGPLFGPGVPEVCDGLDNDCDGLNYIGGPVNIDTRTWYRAYGERIYSGFGTGPITNLGDISGDGIDDIAFGAPDDSLLAPNAGSIYVIQGRKGAKTEQFRTRLPNGDGYWYTRIRGTRQNGRFGSRIASGNIHGSSGVDIVIAAPTARVPKVSQGSIYVFYHPIRQGELVAEDADLQLQGEDADNSAGQALALGDIDNDGFDDFLIGAPNYKLPSGATGGRVYIVYGGANLEGPISLGNADAFFTGAAGDKVGESAVIIGDWDGDGHTDFAFSAPSPTSVNESRIYVKFGTGARLSGEQTADMVIRYPGIKGFGNALITPGDVNGDGLPELIVASPVTGQALDVFISGPDARAGGSVNPPYTALRRTRIQEDIGMLTNFGAPYKLGDINADGLADFGIGAPGDFLGRMGSAYVVYGSTDFGPVSTTQARTITASQLESAGRLDSGAPFPTYSYRNVNGGPGQEGARIASPTNADSVGTSMGAADFDGDGYIDVIVGAERDEFDLNYPEVGSISVLLGGKYGLDAVQTGAGLTYTLSAPAAGMNTWYLDIDADGFPGSYDPSYSVTRCDMHVPISFRDPNHPVYAATMDTTLDLDCDDTNPAIYPGAPERNGDFIDSDCDGFDNTNALPILQVTITPQSPRANDTLFANVDVYDPDTDEVTLTYEWAIKSPGASTFTVIGGQTGSSLPGNFATKGDTVQLTVTGTDTREGVSTKSASVLIVNSPPTVSSCQITPEDPDMFTQLTVTAHQVVDIDPSDTVTVEYKWFILHKGTSIPIPDPRFVTRIRPSCESSNFPAGDVNANTYNCKREDTIIASCTPFDGTSRGPAVYSTAVSVINAPPVIDTCQISASGGSAPTTPSINARGGAGIGPLASSDPPDPIDPTIGFAFTDETLHVSSTAHDVDEGDTVTIRYTWLQDGLPIAGYTNTAVTTLPANMTTHFKSYRVQCIPTDNYGKTGAAVTSGTIQIENSAPTAPIVVITPGSPRSDQALNAILNNPATDPDGDTLSYQVQWQRDGAVYANPSQWNQYPNRSPLDTVAAGTTKRFEDWTVLVRASDGYTVGPTVQYTVSIRNSPPRVDSAILHPDSTPAYTDTVLYITGVGWFDQDNDPENYQVIWFKSTDMGATYTQVPSAQVPAPQTQLPIGLTNRGDMYYAQVTASDPYETGNVVITNTVTIENAPPTMPTASIQPTAPDIQDIKCVLTSTSTDADGDNVYYNVEWYLNGVYTMMIGGVQGPVPVGTTLDTMTPARGNIDYDQVWSCRVWASDPDGAQSPYFDAPSVTIQDNTAPLAPVIDPIDRYMNENQITLTGTCEHGAHDCLDIVYSCTNESNVTITQTQTSACNASGLFSYTIPVTRGHTYECSAICRDSAANPSVVSNKVKTEACDPYDAYELNADPTYGDTSSKAIDEFATLAISASQSPVTIKGNILDNDTYDWYVIRSSADLPTILASSMNTYNFKADITIGSAVYDIAVWRGSPSNTQECQSTVYYDTYQFFNKDRGVNTGGVLVPEHVIPGNPQACGPSGGTVPTLYNYCEDMTSNYYIRVSRASPTVNRDCTYYEVRATNGTAI